MNSRVIEAWAAYDAAVGRFELLQRTLTGKARDRTLASMKMAIGDDRDARPQDITATAKAIAERINARFDDIAQECVIDASVALDAARAALVDALHFEKQATDSKRVGQAIGEAMNDREEVEVPLDPDTVTRV